MLKTIELREHYYSRNTKDRLVLFREYLKARKDFQRTPEDYTDELRATLIATGASFNDWL
jgi:hypothetical protein